MLEQVRALKLQHLLHTHLGDLLPDFAQALRRSLDKAELILDEVLGVLLEELKSLAVLHRRDLDELRDSVPHVRLCKRREQMEIDDHTAMWVESSDAVLVLLCQVAANLDGNGRIDHADQGGREPDIRSRATVKRTCCTADVSDEATANQQRSLTAHQTDVREENHHFLHRLQRLLLFVNTERQDLETHALLLEVCAHRLAVDVIHPRIADGHATPIIAETIGEVRRVHLEASLLARGVNERIVVLVLRGCLYVDLELTVRAGAHRRRSRHRHDGWKNEHAETAGKTRA